MRNFVLEDFMSVSVRFSFLLSFSLVMADCFSSSNRNFFLNNNEQKNDEHSLNAHFFVGSQLHWEKHFSIFFFESFF